MEVRKSDGSYELFDKKKLKHIIKKTFKDANIEYKDEYADEIINSLYVYDGIMCSSIRKQLERRFAKRNESLLKAYTEAKDKRDMAKDFVEEKKAFIERYKKSSNTANATIDDNSNVSSKNIGVLNAEIHKTDNILISRGMIMDELKRLYPDFNPKNYVKDLERHILYKHDESSFSGAIASYCASITMYPYLTNGLKGIGGQSGAPKNLNSYCGTLINLIFAISSQFAGALAVPEALVCFSYFCKKEWGEYFWKRADDVVTVGCVREKTIRSQIHQYFQQIIYTINAPASGRNMQCPFVNFSFFDRYFFDGMFGNFYFPDGTQPDWESTDWIQREFMRWFNEDARMKAILTFPVESFALIYRDGKFQDEESARFVAEELERGHSFFVYISDSVDSLSSCCFSKDQKVLWKSSTLGVRLTTFKELYDTKWGPDKKNLKIYHNGSWVSGKAIKLPNRKMYRVTTANNKVLEMTDNHINVTLLGEKETKDLTTNDYLLFNTLPLNRIPECDEHLTYEQGFVVGAFLGDGSFGTRHEGGKVYDINFSMNEKKCAACQGLIDIANSQIGGKNRSHVSSIYNNVYPVRISSIEMAEFIKRWTCWKEGTYCYNKKLNLNCLLQSYEFRKGILDGWYNTDGGNSNRCYTTSQELAEDMEILILSLGYQSIIDISDKTTAVTGEKYSIRGVDFTRNYPLYCVRWYEPANHRRNKDKETSWIKRNNSLYFKIKSIEELDYLDEVYCIECKDEEEPYFTLPNGVITHNCRLKNKIQTREFNFTNGNIGVQTGSKSVITLNMSRIVQDWFNGRKERNETFMFDGSDKQYASLCAYINKILERVYKYHTAYNELLWDVYDADLLPVYKAGFIDLNKQYLTIGINGVNQAAEFLGIKCSDNDDYSKFCTTIFGNIKEQNARHKVTDGKHKMTFNTECVPAESLAIKNYNWDKEDDYWVPTDTNLYASYIFKPNDPNVSVLEKIRMHGNRFIGDFLDGGSSAHLNLDSHLSKEQYMYLLNYAAENGCQYLTFNVPNCQCEDCGYIAKTPFDKCPKCGSTHVSLWDRVIGYLTKIKNWSNGRQIEQKTRVYEKINSSALC